MKKLLPNQHFSLISTPEVATICKPLFNYSDIDYCWYAQLYSNGRYVSLSTNAEWNLHIFNNEQYLQPNQVLSGLHLLSSFEPDKAFDAANLFNLNHLFIMTEKKNSYFEFFGFASHNKSTSVIDYYFNHIDILNKFQLYFKQKADCLIQKSQSESIMLPGFNREVELLEQQSIANNLSEMLELSKYKIDSKRGDISVTKKQIMCLTLLSKGMTAKQIASCLRVSYRTIEAHIEILKKKLNMHTKKELLKFFAESELAKLYAHPAQK
ncbi:MAG: helix-turn-helix domain-containing protein [Gammaproteobacteria bacterium]|jgi:DNA-binding CsgD family transcriptional regulator